MSLARNPEMVEDRIIMQLRGTTEEDLHAVIGEVSEHSIRTIQFGCEAVALQGLNNCSRIAARHGVKWLPETRFNFPPDSTKLAVDHIVNTEYPPSAINVDVANGSESLKEAIRASEGTRTTILGDITLGSISDEELAGIFRGIPMKNVFNFASKSNGVMEGSYRRQPGDRFEIYRYWNTTMDRLADIPIRRGLGITCDYLEYRPLHLYDKDEDNPIIARNLVSLGDDISEMRREICSAMCDGISHILVEYQDTDTLQRLPDLASAIVDGMAYAKDLNGEDVSEEIAS